MGNKVKYSVSEEQFEEYTRALCNVYDVHATKLASAIESLGAQRAALKMENGVLKIENAELTVKTSGLTKRNDELSKENSRLTEEVDRLSEENNRLVDENNELILKNIKAEMKNTVFENAEDDVHTGKTDDVGCDTVVDPQVSQTKN